MSTTQQVLDRHLSNFFRGDLEAVLADYSSGAVLFTPDAPLRSPKEIRTFFEALLLDFAKPGARFKLDKSLVDGDYAYILWSAETADHVYENATDTFHVAGGKIAAQSFAGKVTGKATGKG
jgi:ketosteroid isomerase-like protein